MLHELGHSFGLLADEYSTSASFIGCDNSIEPPEVNVTRESTRDAIKWSHWIEPDTPVPATPATGGVVSAYEGAKYCTSGLYRPTYDSKMRTLGRPFEFTQVVSVNRPPEIARVVCSPRCESMAVAGGSEVTFFVDVNDPDDDPLTYSWSVTGGAIRGPDNQAVMTWLAPASRAAVDVSVVVADARGGEAIFMGTVNVGS